MQLKLPIFPNTPTIIIGWGAIKRIAVVIEHSGAYWWFPASDLHPPMFGPFNKEEAVKEAKQWANI